MSSSKSTLNSPAVQCRHFNGYKPCSYLQKKYNSQTPQEASLTRSSSVYCHLQCPQYSAIHESIIIIHLGALGAVVRSTALLKQIKERHPHSYLTWVTSSRAAELLKNISIIDQVVVDDENQLKKLRSFVFDTAYVIDKGLEAAGILNSLHVRNKLGFGVHPLNGAVIPLNAGATEMWEIGLDDHKKFTLNQKTENQLIWESLELGEYKKSEYHLQLCPKEKELAAKRHRIYQQNMGQPVIGINTGCSATIPYKKWTVDYQRKIIQEFIALGFENIVLLGGIEDTERNKRIAQGLPVFTSPTDLGLRDGLISVAACDLVITGDSLGMHLAIAMQKYVIAWFGPTVANEIELYDRGQKLLAKVDCGPCWKRHCHRPIMCYDLVPIEEVIVALTMGVRYWRAQTDESTKDISHSDGLLGGLTP